MICRQYDEKAAPLCPRDPAITFSIREKVSFNNVLLIKWFPQKKVDVKSYEIKISRKKARVWERYNGGTLVRKLCRHCHQPFGVRKSSASLIFGSCRQTASASWPRHSACRREWAGRQKTRVSFWTLYLWGVWVWAAPLEQWFSNSGPRPATFKSPVRNMHP